MNPYPGLRPFRPDESHLFMGRETVESVVTTRVRLSPLTLLVARSGIGKSSFLTCRLIPKLGESSVVRYRNEWGGAPAETLIDEELQSLRQVGDRFQDKPVLVLDQFEDVFKLPNPREELWDKFAEVVNIPGSPTNLLVSMREEWLGAWAESTDYLGSAFSGVVRLTPLTREELTRAIRRPTEIEGTVGVEPELADLLIEDLTRPTAFGLGEGYVEPGLLQLVCRRLWEEASNVPQKMMTIGLYNRLGRADRISREFVWNELGRAGSPGSTFLTLDRVLWVGMTRHLVAAQGIKAITDSIAMARKIRMEDLGFAGPAAAQSRLPKRDRAYLRQMPERRGEPPAALVSWISDVVGKGVQLGFLKQQRGLPSVAARSADQTPILRDLFEISHDSLAEMFQQFSVEFETWIRVRCFKLLGTMVVGCVLFPLLAYNVVALGFAEALGIFGMFFLIIIAYLVLLGVMTVLMELIGRTIAYPIIRRLAQGVVPLTAAQRKPRSALREWITDWARRLRFLPR